MTSPVPSQRDHEELIRRCEGIIAEWDERFNAHEKLRTKASETLLVLTGLRLKSLVLSQRDALAALGRERDRANQRIEWASAALAGDEIFGEATTDPLFQQVVQMRRDLAVARDAARRLAEEWRNKWSRETGGTSTFPWEMPVSVPAPKGETPHG